MVKTNEFFYIIIICSFALSDFQIREANALPIAHTYTVMCVLPINLFNQVRLNLKYSSIVFCTFPFSKYLHFYGFGLFLLFF
jgi:hypothetical protein